MAPRDPVGFDPDTPLDGHSSSLLPEDTWTQVASFAREGCGVKTRRQEESRGLQRPRSGGVRL